ncbi:hypothetical protein [Kutzneria sp. 744]|uniref:hypothetical protein n=1 Tax=Kutzneria sp. (strain 744) TaxID=345341 RepID=UPI0003EEC044|nr:hypothetical protein [Kutzneria sp. 744]EWM19744.1 hypothetical protein KUTG_10048 [Kutzneria sp. 744]
MSKESFDTATDQLGPMTVGSRPSPGLRLVAAVVVVLVAVVGVVLAVVFSSSPARPAPLDRADARAVGLEMLRRQAIGDPSVCGLASPELLATLRRAGTCTTGVASGPVPTITPLFSQVCGDRAGVQAQLDPAGRDGKPYAFVSLSQGTDGMWSVRNVAMFTDRDGLRPYQCAPGAGG